MELEDSNLITLSSPRRKLSSPLNSLPPIPSNEDHPPDLVHSPSGRKESYSAQKPKSPATADIKNEESYLEGQKVPGTRNAPLLKEKSAVIVRSTRAAGGEIVFSYKNMGEKKSNFSNLIPNIGSSQSKNAGGEETYRMRYQFKELIEKLAPFHHHICAEPLVILLKGMMKSFEPSFSGSKILTSDGSELIRSWTKRRAHIEEQMKLMMAVLCT